ncbi:MAG: adenylate/guanylate cyclase domain-containing protein [bacterium]
MASSDVQRKLTAIMCADVVGYSRLMGDDHEGTLTTLTDYRKVFSAKITEYKGRVVNAPGDSLLAEFASVVDTVSCAVDVQRELAERNAELPDTRRMDFRIGVNLGDVLVKEGDLYGDGVNIAARLESLAEPGGICISGSVHDQIESRLPLHYQFLGEKEVKNIAKPVPVFRVLSAPGAAAHRVVRAKKKLAVKWRKIALAAAMLIVVGVGGFLGWNYYQQSASNAALAAFEKEAKFPLPDKPSIAVLAFDNLSGDPEQEYFSDGIAESITTRLASLTDIFIIARNSAFIYKGKPVDIRRVGREQGVRYVLEGSVQKAGKRVRITAQLIDAATGKHLWAESYDRELKDVFAIQDEITRNVVQELQVKLTAGEFAHYTRATQNPEAYDLFLRGSKFWFRFTKEANSRAKELFLEAIELDAKYPQPVAFLAWMHMNDARFRWSKDSARSFELAESTARRALEIGEVAAAHALLSRLYTYQRRYREAIAEGERARELEPGNGVGMAAFGVTLMYAGRAEDSAAMMTKALRHMPYPFAVFHHWAGTAYYLVGRHDAAIVQLSRHLERQPHGPLPRLSRQFLIAAYMTLGNEAKARAEVAKLREQQPGVSIASLTKDIKRVPFKDLSFLERHTELLRQAGLPE